MIVLLPGDTVTSKLLESHLRGFRDINITYSSPRGDDLDSRLLRAMVRMAEM
jgi:hypothetical protein